MHVLILTSYVPYPPNHGSKFHVFSQIQSLSQEHDVTLMCPVRDNSGRIQDAKEKLNKYCMEVKFINWQKRSKIKYLPNLFDYIRAGEPIGNFIFYHEELAEALELITAEEHFDIVNIHNNYMAPYIGTISPQSKCKAILTLHNVPYVQLRRMILIEKNMKRKVELFRDWLFQKQSTLKHIKRFDQTITISEYDRSILLKDAPEANVIAIPTGIDTGFIKPLDKPVQFCNLLFIGSMYYSPNIDAVQFLCKEIFPLIKKQISGAQLFIVGSQPPREIVNLGRHVDGIIVTGYVEDVLPYFERSCLTLVPLRAGSGIRIKIIESMSLGRPVISTTLGCEGLQVTHGENILIADTASDFAREVVLMMTTPELWQRIAENGRRRIEQVYDRRVVGGRLIQVYEHIAANGSLLSEW